MNLPSAETDDYAVKPVEDSKRKWEAADNALIDTACEADVKRRKSSIMGAGASAGHGDDNGGDTSDSLNDILSQEVIDYHLSLEILRKHEDLRKLRQELAKSQVGLEQIRRCHLLPFPTAYGTPESMVQISTGTGPSIPQVKGKKPKWASPFGIKEGPYSRHYAKWLIPDPEFDGIVAVPARQHEARGVETRGVATRNSFAVESPIGSRRRGAAGQKLQALPSGYAMAKESAGPSVLKRADGAWVKLVCIDCQRENFGSTQGFINHCRIAHRREFKSHEEAASQSGHVVDVDEFGGIIGESKVPTAVAVTPGSANDLVHPMIRNASTDRDNLAGVMTRLAQSTRSSRSGASYEPASVTGSTNRTPAIRSRAATANKDFVPAPTTPHLSDFLEGLGFNQNLGDFVADAKMAVPDDESSSDDSEVEIVIERQAARTPRASKPARRGLGLDGTIDGDSPSPTRLPARSPVMEFARPTSSKGMSGVAPSTSSGVQPRLPYCTPISMNGNPHHRSQLPHLLPHLSSNDHIETDVSMQDINDLSPATIASNNAPSLVSDDGEYSAGDDDAESHSEMESDSGSDVAEIDFDDDDKLVARAQIRGDTTHAVRLGKIRKDEKHVSFVSPVKKTGISKGRM